MHKVFISYHHERDLRSVLQCLRQRAYCQGNRLRAMVDRTAQLPRPEDTVTIAGITAPRCIQPRQCRNLRSIGMGLAICAVESSTIRSLSSANGNRLSSTHNAQRRSPWFPRVTKNQQHHQQPEADVEFPGVPRIEGHGSPVRGGNQPTHV